MKRRQRLIGLVTVIVLSFAAMAAAQGGAGQIFQGSDVEQFLAKAKVTQLKGINTGVTLPRKATLELNGTTHFAVFKNIDEGPVPSKVLDRGIEVQFQDSWRTEVAAYELDKLLGLGMVPATVMRMVDGQQGSIQYWVDSVMDEGGRINKKLSPPNLPDWQQQIAKLRLWDNLIYNTDRNLGNMLITSDWKIRLIDHSRTFRPFDQLKSPKDLTIFSRTLLAKLETLNEPTLKEHLGKYLTPYQIQGVLKRRDAIIALSKKLVAEKGAGSVLYN